MEKVDRKSPNPKTLDIQKKTDRKWVSVSLPTQDEANPHHPGAG